MVKLINHAIDWFSEFFAHRKGLLPLLGILLVFINAVLQFVPAAGWLADTNLFLHFGVIVAIIGFLLAWAL